MSNLEARPAEQVCVDEAQGGGGIVLLEPRDVPALPAPALPTVRLRSRG